MRIFAFIIGLALCSLAFQNCSESTRNDTIFVEDVVNQSSVDCDGNSCLQNANLLWLLIREFEPYRIDIASLGAGHFTVGGQCGVGTFPNHQFVWELREGFGRQEVIGRGVSENRCDLGQFQVPVTPNVGSLQPDQRYQLIMEIVAFDDDNNQFINSQPIARGALDVIFEINDD